MCAQLLASSVTSEFASNQFRGTRLALAALAGGIQAVQPNYTVLQPEMGAYINKVLPILDLGDTIVYISVSAAGWSLVSFLRVSFVHVTVIIIIIILRGLSLLRACLQGSNRRRTRETQNLGPQYKRKKESKS